MALKNVSIFESCFLPSCSPERLSVMLPPGLLMGRLGEVGRFRSTEGGKGRSACPSWENLEPHMCLTVCLHRYQRPGLLSAAEIISVLCAAENPFREALSRTKADGINYSQPGMSMRDAKE